MEDGEKLLVASTGEWLGDRGEGGAPGELFDIPATVVGTARGVPRCCRGLAPALPSASRVGVTGGVLWTRA